MSWKHYGTPPCTLERLAGKQLIALHKREYTYEPLAADSIRLLRILPESTPTDIHCTLVPCETLYESTTEYVAVSYCWGDTKVTKPVTLNGCEFDVTTNLWNALSAILRFHDTECLYWIDAICLDQSNVEERNHQVHHMWRIYSTAAYVFTWLGPENEYTEASFSVLEDVAKSCTIGGRHCPGWKKRHPSLTESLEELLRPLSTNEFFSRTWVIQEFVQARQLKIVCGRYSVDGDILFHLQKFWSGLHIGELLSNRWHHVTQQSTKEPQLDLKECVKHIAERLFTYSRSKCTDRRDRIFALLGDPLIRRQDLSRRLRPDYQIEVYELAIVFVEYCDMIFKDLWDVGDHLDVEVKSHLNSLLYSLGQALQLKGGKGDSIERYGSQLPVLWDDITMSRSLVLPSGRKVNGFGPLMIRLRAKAPSPSREMPPAGACLDSFLGYMKSELPSVWDFYSSPWNYDSVYFGEYFKKPYRLLELNIAELFNSDLLFPAAPGHDKGIIDSSPTHIAIDKMVKDLKLYDKESGAFTMHEPRTLAMHAVFAALRYDGILRLDQMSRFNAADFDLEMEATMMDLNSTHLGIISSQVRRTWTILRCEGIPPQECFDILVFAIEGYLDDHRLSAIPPSQAALTSNESKKRESLDTDKLHAAYFEGGKIKGYQPEVGWVVKYDEIDVRDDEDDDLHVEDGFDDDDEVGFADSDDDDDDDENEWWRPVTNASTRTDVGDYVDEEPAIDDDDDDDGDDCEGGFAESDSESDDDEEYVWWTPGTNSDSRPKSIT